MANMSLEPVHEAIEEINRCDFILRGECNIPRVLSELLIALDVAKNEIEHLQGINRAARSEQTMS